MKKFINFLNESLLNEYLTDGQREKYSKVKMTPQAKDATDHFFGKDNDHVREDITGHDEENKSEVHKKVEGHLGSNIDVESYKKGLTKDKHGRDVRIGKVIKDESLRNEFAKDSTRAGVKSSHGHYCTVVRGTEVAGQTNSAPNAQHPHGHSWGDESCKNIDSGSNKKYLSHEVKHGTVLVRIHDHSDKEIYRATLHPHLNDHGHTAYDVNSEYGIKHPSFSNHAKDVAKRLSGTHKGGSSQYKIHPKVYNDTENSEDSLGKHYMVHPNISSDNLKNIKLSKEVIKHPNATKEQLDAGMEHEDPEVRKAVASHPNATKEHLDKAIEDNNSEVRRAVIQNYGASKEHLSKALKDKDSFNRSYVFNHPNATKEHVDTAIKDKSALVRAEAMRHRDATKHHLDVGIKDKNSSVRENALRNRNATEEHYNIALNDKEAAIREYSVKSSHTSKENLMKASKDTDEYVRAAAASHPKADKNMLDHLLNDSSSKVRAAALKNPVATMEHIKKGSKDTEPRVRAAAASHPKADKNMLDHLLNDEDGEVRTAVVSNPSATMEHIKKGIKDEHGLVSYAAERAHAARTGLK
jgi:hypothetical protein